MILIIPSIELKNGICCQKINEIGSGLEVFQNLSENPSRFIKLLRRENAKSVCLIDSDSFDNSNNYDNWEVIEQIKLNTDIPIQLNYNFRSIDDLYKAKQIGISRIIISFQFFLENVIEIIEFGNKFGFSCISIKLMFSKILEFENILKIISKNNIYRIVLTPYNINDLESLYNLISKYKIKITLQDNITSSKELINLNKSNFPNIDSLILGEALYQNVFPCQAIWREIEEILEPNI
ncbi:MAG: HisA/HisF-related TIM barrel protein [Candidatus Kapabacteria bacterium]|nr:HisA/HisF-related TIM barrel protein [Candidatus Kapabacteria bacterium]